MKKIKSNKLVFAKKSIVELSKEELLKINGGTSTKDETPTLSIYTGNALCAAVFQHVEN